MISKRAGRISVHGVAIGVMALLFSLPPRAAADDGECRGSHGRAAVADALAAAEAQCNCGGAQSNGDFVSCVAEVARQRANAHQLPNQCRGRVQECAAQSTCGRPGAVTCCRTDSSGVSHCSIKSDASECDAPDGGSVCTSTFPSCCTACQGGDGQLEENQVQCCISQGNGNENDNNDNGSNNGSTPAENHQQGKRPRPGLQHARVDGITPLAHGGHHGNGQGDNGDGQGGDQGNGGAECRLVTADECTREGGINVGTGTCEPNPCAAATTTTTIVSSSTTSSTLPPTTTSTVPGTTTSTSVGSTTTSSTLPSTTTSTV